MNLEAGADKKKLAAGVSLDGLGRRVQEQLLKAEILEIVCDQTDFATVSDCLWMCLASADHSPASSCTPCQKR